MTLKETYEKGKTILCEAGVQNPAFDALYLFEHCFKVDRHMLLLKGSEPACCELSQKFFELIKRRASGYPLQYIIGTWEFLGMPFEVGEGVFIPRPETELLCETAAGWIRQNRAKSVLDLCGGSGAVAIGIAHLCPGVKVVSVEKSETALKYLNSNIRLNKMDNVTAVRADVLEPPPENLPLFDAVVSNPPYVADREMDFLQREIAFEPEMAFKAGRDGLDFYRAICKNWLCALRPGGLIALEVGKGQASYVKELLSGSGVENIKTVLDYSNIERVVTGNR